MADGKRFKMFVCTAKDCTFSDKSFDASKYDGKKTVSDAIAAGEISPHYGAISVEDGKRGKCPWCGAKLTVVEDDSHKTNRVMVPNLTALDTHTRLIVKRLRSSQYKPTKEFLDGVVSFYATLFDNVQAAAAYSLDRQNGVSRSSTTKNGRKVSAGIAI